MQLHCKRELWNRLCSNDSSKRQEQSGIYETGHECMPQPNDPGWATERMNYRPQRTVRVRRRIPTAGEGREGKGQWRPVTSRPSTAFKQGCYFNVFDDRWRSQRQSDLKSLREYVRTVRSIDHNRYETDMRKHRARQELWIEELGRATGRGVALCGRHSCAKVLKFLRG